MPTFTKHHYVTLYFAKHHGVYPLVKKFTTIKVRNDFKYSNLKHYNSNIYYKLSSGLFISRTILVLT
ncbi:hypothetical protein FHS70_000606 [Flammeovirga yaeyamensis]|nr:hypothetical protein [Flammeovirga yaeyamensis]